MRGHIRQRYKGTWSIVVDLGRRVDPNTGLLKRVQKWFTFRGTRKQAEGKLTTLLHDADRGQVIAVSKLTVGEWLDEWLQAAIAPPKRRLRTYESYRSVIENHFKPNIGQFRLFELRAAHLQHYYDQSTLSRSTLQQHHAIVYSALKAALKADMIPRNVADLVMSKPRARADHDTVLHHCWEADEATKFLSVAKEASPQAAAFYSLALDTGARKAELCGLRWSDADLEQGKVMIVRQLVKPGPDPLFGPPKNGRPRTIDLTPGTVTLLRKHKRAQAELRLSLGTAYHDHGLMFGKDNGPGFGHPLQMSNIGQREYARLIKLAGVRRIKFHGLRHTCATHLLKNGVPVHVVSERLGHRGVEITLEIYAHVLPSMQKDAAAKLEAIFHG